MINEFLFFQHFDENIKFLGSPSINVSFDLTDDVNTVFILNCTSMGRPIYQMLWLLDNTSLFDNYDPFPTLVDAETALYYSILQVHGRKLGTYSCLTTNEHNVSISSEHYIVRGKITNFMLL